MNLSKISILVFIALLIFSAVISCDDDDDDDDDATVDDDVSDDDATDDDVADDDDDDDAADDDDDVSDDDDDDTVEKSGPVVFVHLTDIHQSRISGSDKGEYGNFNKSLEYIRDNIDPDFVVSTGDLTDGYGPLGQAQAEWDDYHNAIVDAGFTSANYHDVPGNHDVHNDDDYSYYLDNGISGELQHSWTISRDGFDYAFMTLLTAYPDYMEGWFTQASYNWADTELAKFDGYDHIFCFAHHNSVIVPDAGLTGPGGLLDTFAVTGFIAGHRHMDTELNYEDTRFIKTAQHYRGMPSSDDGRMRLFVLDGLNWASSSAYVVDRGAHVIIVSPQDKAYSVTRSPTGHQVSGVTTIKAMAFGQGTISLEMAIDDGTPIVMDTDDGRIFTAEFDFGTLDPGDHEILVEDPNRSNNLNGRHVITVESAAKSRFEYFF